MSTTTADNKELVHEYLAAWNDADPAAVPPLLADDFSTPYTDPSGNEVELDVGAFQDLMAGYFEVFSDMGHEIHEMVAEDDWVITRIHYSGVHEGEFMGIETTGNRIRVEEFLSFRIEDGEIAELHSVSDGLALLRQLDVNLPLEP